MDVVQEAVGLERLLGRRVRGAGGGRGVRTGSHGHGGRPMITRASSPTARSERRPDKGIVEKYLIGELRDDQW
jgi:hypothetical protein